MTNNDAIRILTEQKNKFLDEWIDYGGVAEAYNMAINLLDKQIPKEPIHFHQEYPEHDWIKDEDGKIDEWAMSYGYCNGPMCKRCYHGFCIHCEPDGWNNVPCVLDFYKCPSCEEQISKNIKFCDNCGQAVKWDA